MPALNTSSLPDLIFTLLFFFMMVTTMREVSLKVEFKVPQATELEKLEKKSLVTFIYVGRPTAEFRKKLGSESRIQLNDSFAEVADIQDYIIGERASMKEEEKRKIRIAAGGIDAVWKLRPLLNAFRYGIFTFQYISHRVLRWTLTPFFLFLLLPINLALLFDEECQLFYAVILLFQIIFYALSALGYLMQKLQLKNKIVFVPYYFVFMNLNVIKGISYLYKQRNNKNGGAWEKAKRAS